MAEDGLRSGGTDGTDTYAGEALIRVRMSQHDAHYGGDLVDGARMLALFGDVATELLIRCDGDEGLFAGYHHVAFRAPVYAGDYIEARGRITKIGDTSRRMVFAAYKVIAASRDPAAPSRAQVLNPPLLVCEAEGTCVVPKDRQRGRDGGWRS
ncbi:hotdog fold domain-containing protein [Alicyclobacillus macrosporangiidus]|uniref:3-aminobutyryl-CoA ammonia-lyase n=1 Tax=Alicyclobacillus macrosporangiidus TaxID=392015 RepID=A0A1I7HT38_9BACL|nr:hotdog fold domain-containing protein [Alicyclobacillus macrosporangiidus]SFU63857.1 3-aminobutyryl-CoA ammonia-lyase [Alicyclobacillus macrosporangiidus]